jgi:glyoxylase-like metal-dependent hydrolase (beta-lactamase superfamily II)
MLGTGTLLTGAPGVIHCLLVETDEGLLLVDTGLGTRDLSHPAVTMRMFLTVTGSTRDPAETALAQVRRLGCAPEDVRHIFLTHFHLDHAGGLPDFPHAKVHLYAAEYDALTHPRDMHEHEAYRREHRAHGPDWVIHAPEGNAWFGFESTPPVRLGTVRVCFVPLPGHTRGHCGVALRLPDGWLLHAGDAYVYHGSVDPDNPHQPRFHAFSSAVLSLSKPWRQFDLYAAQLQALLRDHGDEVTVFCSHDPADLAKFG